jgi:hypothetical protein
MHVPLLFLVVAFNSDLILLFLLSCFCVLTSALVLPNPVAGEQGRKQGTGLGTDVCVCGEVG